MAQGHTHIYIYIYITLGSLKDSLEMDPGPISGQVSRKRGDPRYRISGPISEINGSKLSPLGHHFGRLGRHLGIILNSLGGRALHFVPH